MGSYIAAATPEARRPSSAGRASHRKHRAHDLRITDDIGAPSPSFAPACSVARRPELRFARSFARRPLASPHPQLRLAPASRSFARPQLRPPLAASSSPAASPRSFRRPQLPLARSFRRLQLPLARSFAPRPELRPYSCRVRASSLKRHARRPRLSPLSPHHSIQTQDAPDDRPDSSEGLLPRVGVARADEDEALPHLHVTMRAANAPESSSHAPMRVSDCHCSPYTSCSEP